MSNITGGKKAAAEDDDLQYVVLCQKGHAEAFEALVERHQKKMLNIAFRMTGDYDEACDITQEAFLAAYKSIKKFKAEAKFSTWLYRIVVNYSKNRLKQMRGMAKREGGSLDDAGETKAEGRLNQSLVHCANPGTQMETREREAQVQKCITSLDEEYRDVLVLRDIQGFSYEEIRDILKIPEGTVKSRISRARSALKDCLVKVIGDL
ncbi:MAG: RNA polymerase subunit sigma-24 [Deltaproteobacteria bacterium HGW-Deltaproteobacteria-13]|jgi:RNA polymerase sigma-70 factor (ECF subfamily)|nr:MAG: RNA polymerase subunit sigma-24 [Deltaproteobacteria bacterium HGW-Deltaproteobacteria-13]